VRGRAIPAFRPGIFIMLFLVMLFNFVSSSFG
jgi:hypothetical protein